MQKIKKFILWLTIIGCIGPLPAFAARLFMPENAPHIVWMQISAILVIFMTVPGLAIFYGGLVQRKNILSMVVPCFIIVAITSLMWVIIGYTLSYTNGGVLQPFIGGFKYIFVKGLYSEKVMTAPHTLVFLIYQMGFAMIAPAIIIGSFAERINNKAALLFITLWELLVYYPVCHWAWGGGWLEKLGLLDFAGGTVVHINAGITGLVAAILLGQREHFSTRKIMPHNLVLVAIGTGILWIGWFGFNSGGAEHFYLTTSVILISQLAASACIITWMIMDWLRHGKATATGIMLGAVAGLVAITPASGFVDTIGAICIGIITGIICQLFIELKFYLGYDDSLDVFGVHGIGGIIGSILTGVFAAKILGGAGTSFHYSIVMQVAIQFLSVVATLVWAGGITYLLLKVLDKTIGLRVDAKIERTGLDLNTYGEQGYDR